MYLLGCKRLEIHAELWSYIGVIRCKPIREASLGKGGDEFEERGSGEGRGVTLYI